jgi:lipoprotein NlpD
VPPSSLAWLWPTAGKVIDGFDPPRNKGIDIGGTEGAPVLAAADGEVITVTSALRGYGNLVILRHAGEYVTAYGHNRKILVSQGQQVKRGQQIAELGRTDADRPKLHFEIRHQGKPLDPVKYLPPR